MTRCVVLLKGVNVGGGKRVPMADLAAILSGLGCAGVRTLLNSGNAVCVSQEPPRRLEAAVRGALLERLSVDTPVIVVTESGLAAVIEENPLGAVCTDPSRLLVVFPQRADALPPLTGLVRLARPPERFALGTHAAYLWCPNGSLQSEVGKALLGREGRDVTTRNWATVLKLQALLRAAG